MKRHIALQPLSREHHGALLLAQLLRNDAPDYAGLPTDFYRETLQQHFEKEETIFNQSKGLATDLDTMIDETIAEHLLLKKLFTELNTPYISNDQLHTLGLLLNSHIRNEERVLFPLLEQYCSAELLEQFRLLL
jgi:iron-sulfur cluster repair protein YtfE (RIC family)